MLDYLLIIAFLSLTVLTVIFLLKNDRGEKEPVSALWLAALFGLIGAIAAAFIEKELIPLRNIVSTTPLRIILPSFLSIGLIEESLKFLPLAIFLYPKRYFNEHTDGIIYFAIAGFGFGLPENILYTLQYGATAGLGRLVLTPFFHAAITAMIGYFLARAKLAKKSPWSIWPVFLMAVIIHGLYDFGLTPGTNNLTMMSVAITLALSIGSLGLFFKAKDLDEDRGLASIGSNNYCRTCGLVNVRHYLYCTRCGKRA